MKKKKTVRINVDIFAGKLEPEKWECGTFKAQAQQKVVETKSLWTNLLFLNHWLLKEAQIFWRVSQRMVA